MHDLGERSGFPIRPLMLRHTYAIYTLLMLRTNPNFKGEPLMYVRDRLGHSSVQTTLVYLKQIERLSGGEARDEALDGPAAQPADGGASDEQSK